MTVLLPHHAPPPAEQGDDHCPPVIARRAALEPVEAEQLARRFRALAHPVRVRLLSLIAAQPAAETCVCDLTTPVGPAQGTASFHQKTLVDARLLTREQRGRRGVCRPVDGALVDGAVALGPI